MAYPKPKTIRVEIPAGSYGRGRGAKISQISEHHIVGDAVHVINKAKSQQFSCTYTISTDGTIYQLVSEGNTAYCDNAWQSNARSISIEHAGGHANFPYTEKMYKSSIKLHAYLFDKYPGIKPVRHRDIPESPATACPGNLNVDRIVKEARQLIKGEEMYKGKSAQHWYSRLTKEQQYTKDVRKYWQAKLTTASNKVQQLQNEMVVLRRNPSQESFAAAQKTLNECRTELAELQAETHQNEEKATSFLQTLANILKRLKP